MFINIDIDYRYLETRKTRNCFRYETFYYLWVKDNSIWGERDTIFLCWLLLHHQLSTQPTRSACSAQIRLASPRSECRLSRSAAGTQLTAFSQIPKILGPLFRCMTSFTPPGHISYLEFYFDICEWRILPACTWTPALMLHLTNQCTKRKVLILTKPKGKIYKTKSLRHNITDPPYPSLKKGYPGYGIKLHLVS